MKQRLSFSRIPLALPAGALGAGFWAVLTPFTPAATGATARLCTRVVEHGSCVTLWGPITIATRWAAPAARPACTS